VTWVELREAQNILCGVCFNYTTIKISFTPLRFLFTRFKNALRVTMVEVAWAEGGPEHKFWPEDPNCKNLVTRFAKVR